jgi:Ser-tRNA(Ala) deacylase AlaX
VRMFIVVGFDDKYGNRPEESWPDKRYFSIQGIDETPCFNSHDTI